MPYAICLRLKATQNTMFTDYTVQPAKAEKNRLSICKYLNGLYKYSISCLPSNIVMLVNKQSGQVHAKIKAAACSELFSSKLHQHFQYSSINVERPTQLSKSTWCRLHQKIEKKLVKFVPGSIFNLLKQAHVATRGIASLYGNYTKMIFMYSKSFKILLFTFITSRPKHVQQHIKQFDAGWVEMLYM